LENDIHNDTLLNLHTKREDPPEAEDRRKKKKISSMKSDFNAEGVSGGS